MGSDQDTRASFILSTARSGSTLLRYILDTHPEISSPAETFLGQLCRDLYLTVNHTKGEVAAAQGKTKDQFVLGEVRRIVLDLMNSYARAKNKSMWCEKTPANVNHMDLLMGVFPEAKYICLYRNCMDVVHSHIEANLHGWYPDLVRYIHRSPENIIGAMVENWVDKTGRILKFELAHTANCFRLKYESLVFDPHASMKSLFAFLSVEWNPSVLDAVFSSRHDVGFGDVKIRFSRKIIRNSVGKGSKLPRRAIPDDLLEKANHLLARLDYPVIGPEWDFTPSPYHAEREVEQVACADAVKQVFTSHIPQRVRRQIKRLRGVRGAIKFIIPELGGMGWMVDLTGEAGHPVPGGSAADCTIMISADDLMNVVSGRSNAGEAFLQGKVKISGNSALANMACQLFFQDELNAE
jgi:protein-tyrosine sulfotransferase